MSQLLISATGIQLLDDDGGIEFDFAWEDDAQPALAALTEAFGFEPEESIQPGNPHAPEYTVYSWNGFTLKVEIVGMNKNYPYPVFASATAESVGDIRLRSASGATVGLTVDQLAVYNPIVSEWQDGSRQFKIDPEFPELTDPSSPEATETVRLSVAPGEDVVSELTAPQLSHGGL